MAGKESEKDAVNHDRLVTVTGKANISKLIKGDGRYAVGETAKTNRKSLIWCISF